MVQGSGFRVEGLENTLGAPEARRLLDAERGFMAERVRRELLRVPKATDTRGACTGVPRP